MLEPSKLEIGVNGQFIGLKYLMKALLVAQLSRAIMACINPRVLGDPILIDLSLWNDPGTFIFKPFAANNILATDYPSGLHRTSGTVSLLTLICIHIQRSAF